MLPATDTVPPVIDRFVIAKDAPATPGVTVTLDVAATDYPIPGASGVQACKFIEFEYSLGAHRWIPIQQSGWVDYLAAHNNYPWTLISTYGMRYMQAWCADNARNISLDPGVDVINLLPSTQEGYVAQHGVDLYRIYLEQGQVFTATLTSVDGDADLYVWGPDGQLRYSNNVGVEDTVIFNAPVAGTYQIEVHGYSDAHYRLTWGTQASLARYATAQATNSKPLPTAPAVPLSEHPLYFEITPPQPVTRHYVYLPLIRR